MRYTRYTKQAALDIARRISLEAQRDELRVQLEAMTRERDEARAAMHRREAEVVSARNERDGLARRLDAVTGDVYDLVRERNRAHNDMCLAREGEARMRAALEAATAAMACLADSIGLNTPHGRTLSAVALRATDAARAALSAPSPEPSERTMRAALRKYGRHESMCDVGNTGCDCGLDSILGS